MWLVLVGVFILDFAFSLHQEQSRQRNNLFSFGCLPVFCSKAASGSSLPLLALSIGFYWLSRQFMWSCFDQWGANAPVSNVLADSPRIACERLGCTCRKNKGMIKISFRHWGSNKRPSPCSEVSNPCYTQTLAVLYCCLWCCLWYCPCWRKCFFGSRADFWRAPLSLVLSCKRSHLRCPAEFDHLCGVGVSFSCSQEQEMKGLRNTCHLYCGAWQCSNA